MNSAHEWLLAAPLLVSLSSIGTAGASELDDSAHRLFASDGLVDEHAIQFSARPAMGLTARLDEVGAHQDAALRHSVADEWIRRPRGNSNAAEEDGAGWRVGGALVGALAVGVPMGVAAQALNGTGGVGVAVGLAGGVVGGVCGLYLGGFARNGSSGIWSRSATFSVLNVVVRVAAVALAASFKLNLSPVQMY